MPFDWRKEYEKQFGPLPVGNPAADFVGYVADRVPDPERIDLPALHKAIETSEEKVDAADIVAANAAFEEFESKGGTTLDEMKVELFGEPAEYTRDDGVRMVRVAPFRYVNAAYITV